MRPAAAVCCCTASRGGLLTARGRARRAELKLTSGKGLADLTVPLSTLIDAVVKQNKARGARILAV